MTYSIKFNRSRSNQPEPKKRLSSSTWVLGDSPSQSMKNAAGCWVDKTHDKQARHGKGGKIGGSGR